MKDQKNRIGAYVNKLLDENLSEGQTAMILGNQPDLPNGNNIYMCKNYSAIACSSNDRSCINVRFCGSTVNKFMCQNDDDFTNVISAACNPK